MWTSLIWMSTKLCFSKTCLYSFAVCLITVNVRWRTDAIRIKVTRAERGKTSKYGSFLLVGNTAYDLRLAPWAGKMILILRCDWVPQRTSWNYSPSPRLRKIVLLSLYNKPKINQTCSVKIAGYWHRSFLACLWTETECDIHVRILW